MKYVVMILFTMVLLGAVQSEAQALDRQGKRSLETHTSRPHENWVASTGAQKVQDNTKKRVSKILNK